MNTTRARLATPVDDVLTNYIYLTLVAHADVSGLVAGLTLTDLGDFAGSGSTAETQRCLLELEYRDKVRVTMLTRRQRTYRLLRVTDLEKSQATSYVARVTPRVNALRAKRAELLATERDIEPDSVYVINGVTIEFSNLVQINKDDRKRWRFDVHMTNIGLVRNCMISAYDGKYALYGPGRPTNAEKTAFRDWFEFAAHMRSLVVAAFLKRLQDSTSPIPFAK